MSSASARLSKGKVERDYLTHASLVSMYNSIISVQYQDYRVFSTTVHLIIEICLKKLALLYGLGISRTSHSVSGLMKELAYKDTVVASIYKELGRTGELSEFQKFSYNDLRFYEDVAIPKLRLSTMATVAHTLLARLDYMERKTK